MEAKLVRRGLETQNHGAGGGCFFIGSDSKDLEGRAQLVRSSGSDSRGGADFLLGGLERCITIEKGAPGEGNEQVLSKVLNAIECEISVTTQGESLLGMEPISYVRRLRAFLQREVVTQAH